MVARISVYQVLILFIVLQGSETKERGVSVYVKHTLRKWVWALKITYTDVTWIKLDHSYFKLNRDVYLASVYISPEHTSGNVPDIDSVYSKLLQDIEICSKEGDIVLQGDFNAYTKSEPDYIASDNSHFASDSDTYYVSDIKLPRNDSDTKRLNNSGKSSISLLSRSWSHNNIW